MPESGDVLWGKTWVSFNAPTVDIPVVVQSGTATGIEAAIWWPEATEYQENAPVDTHSDVDLSLYPPGVASQHVAKSNGGPGVFERIVYERPQGVTAGTWKLRINGYSILRPPQIVYWSLRLKRSASVAIP